MTFGELFKLYIIFIISVSVKFEGKQYLTFFLVYGKLLNNNVRKMSSSSVQFQLNPKKSQWTWMQIDGLKMVCIASL